MNYLFVFLCVYLLKLNPFIIDLLMENRISAGLIVIDENIYD